MEEKIPIYEAVFSERMGFSITAISFVENPAMRIQFQKFNEVKRQYFDESKKIVTAVAILADTPILRSDEAIGDHFVLFKAEQVKLMAKSFINSSFTSLTNFDHNSNPNNLNAELFESIIVDRSRGINPPEYFSDIADGSWIISYDIKSEEAWGKIKSGEVNGVSIETFYDLKKIK